MVFGCFGCHPPPLPPPLPPTLERQCIFVCTVNIDSHELRWQRHPISCLFCLYKCHRFRHLPWERHCLHFSECDVFFRDIADNIFRRKWTQCFLKWFLYIPIHSQRLRIVLNTWNRDHSPDYAYVIILIMYREIHFFLHWYIGFYNWYNLVIKGWLFWVLASRRK